MSEKKECLKQPNTAGEEAPEIDQDGAVDIAEVKSGHTFNARLATKEADPAADQDWLLTASTQPELMPATGIPNLTRYLTLEALAAQVMRNQPQQSVPQ